MGIFRYTATTPDGKKRSGYIRSSSVGSVKGELLRSNLDPIKIKEKAVPKDLFGRKVKFTVKRKELTVFTRMLATMISSGMTLLEALETLYEQVTAWHFKMALDDIIERIRSGSDLSSAIAVHPKIFSEIYVQMVKAAEASGQLDAILERLAEYLETAEELKREIKGAMMYPVFSLCLIFGITGFLMIFILPKFQKMFEQMQMKELPAITNVMLGIGDFCRGNAIMVIVGIAVFIAGFRQFLKTTFGRKSWDLAKFYLPVFGDMIRKVTIARFSKTLATLLESGVNLITSLDIVGGVSGNVHIKKICDHAKDEIGKGKNLSEVIGRHKLFPPILIRMIAVGEKTGHVEALLKKLAEFYEHEVRTTIKALTSIVEPLLISIMGIFVGLVVLSIFMPLLSMIKKFGG
ncbi:MAG: type II secretion system F family protein [Planctomycetes bacterium]|nr:type II secretion system F family protein [Planctomycetota bacterium]